MLKTLAKGLLGRVLAYAVFALGLWLLFQGFQDSSVALGILGGGTVLAAMYLMVNARRVGPTESDGDSARHKEESAGDSLDGGDEGD